MLANRGELLAKIRLGEDSFLELKEVRLAGGKIRGPAQDDLADELAAFANSAGGVLLLGVEDKAREVVGIPIERLDAVEALLRQACEDSLRPPLAPLIERLTLPDGPPWPIWTSRCGAGLRRSKQPIKRRDCCRSWPWPQRTSKAACTRRWPAC
ncbi:MAG: Divergent AAA domain protein [Candidatus Accumulibacter phosphatis]|uniref:Divergent AAA domain protein n=1 Tax=Candidatus Accumulibacter phosphatis TaxID=327160 RepID=A0A080LR43_9PROT|nr:MAG: Divergent AAA domain protein [Candidatus Accumulibacter phosphatis]